MRPFPFLTALSCYYKVIHIRCQDYKKWTETETCPDFYHQTRRLPKECIHGHVCTYSCASNPRAT